MNLTWLKWLVVGSGATAVGLLIREVIIGGPEVSPDEAPPVPNPPGEVPDFPFATVGTDSLGRPFFLDIRAGNAFKAMQGAAAAAGIALPISTAWRSRTWQQALYDRYQNYLAGGPWAPKAARPGTSKHEVGLALDLNGVDIVISPNLFVPARRAWLDANAARYGWTNEARFWKNREDWHWEWSPSNVA